MMVVNTELSVTKEEIRSLLRGRTPYTVQEYSIIPAKHEKVFNSLAEALDFLSKVRLVGTTKVCECIIERKRLMSFYSDAPFEVSHSEYNGCNYTFFKGTGSINRNFRISTYDNIVELFSEYYYIGKSKYEDPFVPAKIVLEKVGNITHVYEESSYYDWVEKEIIAKY